MSRSAYSVAAERKRVERKSVERRLPQPLKRSTLNAR